MDNYITHATYWNYLIALTKKTNNFPSPLHDCGYECIFEHTIHSCPGGTPDIIGINHEHCVIIEASMLDDKKILESKKKYENISKEIILDVFGKKNRDILDNSFLFVGKINNEKQQSACKNNNINALYFPAPTEYHGGNTIHDTDLEEKLQAFNGFTKCPPTRIYAVPESPPSELIPAIISKLYYYIKTNNEFNSECLLKKFLQSTYSFFSEESINNFDKTINNCLKSLYRFSRKKKCLLKKDNIYNFNPDNKFNQNLKCVYDWEDRYTHDNKQRDLHDSQD